MFGQRGGAGSAGRDDDDGALGFFRENGHEGLR
jgi:hypothetical protein